MPGRYQENQRKLIYKFLVDRDGEQCIGCLYHYDEFRGPPGTPLEIDHADGDIHNSEPSNLHLLCTTCNLSLRGKSSEEHRTLISLYSAYVVRVREGEKTGVRPLVLKLEKRKKNKNTGDSTAYAREIVDYMSGSPEMQANNVYEVKARNIVLETLRRYEVFDYNQLRDGTAELVGCSVISVDRYFRKLFSAAGPCRKYKDEGSGIWMATLRVKVERKRRISPSPSSSPTAGRGDEVGNGEGKKRGRPKKEAQ